MRYLTQPSKAELALPAETLINPYCSCIRPVPVQVKEWPAAGDSHTFTLRRYCDKCGKDMA